MAVAYDSVGPSSSGARVTTGTITWSHTTVAANAWAIVTISMDNNLSSSLTSATWDGSPMTNLGTIATSGSANCFLQSWSVPNTGAAGSHSISIVYSTGADIEGGSVAFTGVTGLGTAVTSQSTAVTVSTQSSNSRVYSAFGAGDTISAQPATNRWVNNVTGGAGQQLGNGGASDTAGTGGNVTMTWTTAATSNAQACWGIELQSGAAGIDSLPVVRQPGSSLTGPRFQPVVTVGDKTVTTGVVNTVTATDTLSQFTETTSRVVANIGRNPTDTLSAFTESTTRVVTLVGRTAADTLTQFTETATRIVTHPRAVTDTLTGFTETTARLVSLVRTVTDTLAAFTETATRASQLFVRTASDSLTQFTESTSTGGAHHTTVTASDTLDQYTETVTRVTTHPRAPTDTLGVLGESVTRLVALGRTASDSLTQLSETATRAAQAFVRTASDSLGQLTESVSTGGAHHNTVTASDSLDQYTEMVTRICGHVRAVADTLLALTETTTTHRGAIRAPTDTLTQLSETATRAPTHPIRQAVDLLAALVDVATYRPKFTVGQVNGVDRSTSTVAGTPTGRSTLAGTSTGRTVLAGATQNIGQVSGRDEEL